jgi:hypothetical protein
MKFLGIELETPWCDVPLSVGVAIATVLQSLTLRCARVAELYGRSLNVFSWKERRLIQTIDLGPQGVAPLEVRFLHDPRQAQGFVGCAMYAKVFR